MKATFALMDGTMCYTTLGIRRGQALGQGLHSAKWNLERKHRHGLSCA